MNFEVFGFIVILAFLASFLVFVIAKNKDLKNELSQKEKKSKDLEKSPVPGFSQEVWNELSEKMIDSSDEYVMLFDEKLRLRLWNKTAGSLFQFEAGIELTQLVEALNLESKSSLTKSIKQLQTSPANMDEEVELSWKSGEKLRTKLEVVLNDKEGIQAFAMSGVSEKDNSTSGAKLSSVLANVEDPIMELKVIDGELQGIFENDKVDKNQLIEIRNRQRALIEAVQSILEFYKGHGAKLNLAEETCSASANALVRSLSLLLENADLPMELSVDKSLQLTDVNLLIQTSNFQRLVIDLCHFILGSATASRALASLRLNWEQAPMDVSLSFSFEMTQLGQSIGAQWMKSCLEDRSEFIRFESKLASLSCSLGVFEKSGEHLNFKIVIPRDIT